MGLETQIRQSAKAEKVAGATVVEIIHPLTKVADPSSLLPTDEEIQTAIAANDYSYLNCANGINSSIITQVQYDLAYALTVYEAFEVDPNQENAQTILGTAIDAYGSSLTIDKDDYEIDEDLNNASVKALKLGAVSAANINASFNRNSAIRGIVTLESLATLLGISFDGGTNDSDLATAIKSAIDLL